jgi:hypothetical protein
MTMRKSALWSANRRDLVIGFEECMKLVRFGNVAAICRSTI